MLKLIAVGMIAPRSKSKEVIQDFTQRHFGPGVGTYTGVSGTHTAVMFVDPKAPLGKMEGF